MSQYIPTEELIGMLKGRNLSPEDITAITDAIRPWRSYPSEALPKGCVVEVKLSKKVLGTDKHPAKIVSDGIIIVAGHFLFDLSAEIVAWRNF